MNAFRPTYVQAMQQQLAAKLGLTQPQAGDGDLFQDLLDAMQANRSDWTLTFRTLAEFSSSAAAAIPQGLAAQFVREPQRLSDWATRYRARLRAENSDDSVRAAAMNAVNPRFVLRHHLAQAAIAQAEAGDFSEVRRLLQALRQPFDATDAPAHYAQAPADDAPPACLSCSS